MSATDKKAIARQESNEQLWRSLEERAGKADLDSYLQAEFPSLAGRIPVDVDRRTLLKLVGASLSMAGLAACSPAREIVPYVRQPEIVIPGKPLYYATALSSQGYGIGAVVESHEGRPTKIEGNPDHPGSRGGSDAVMQAAILELFDPERSRTPVKNGDPAFYGDFLADMATLSSRLAPGQGKGCAILIEATTSPTLKTQLGRLRSRYPSLQIYGHDALATPGAEKATQSLLGRACVPVYHLDKADVIVSLDSDFLGQGAGRLAYASEFAARRRVRDPGDQMNRLFAVTTTPTITAAAADHHHAIRPSQVEPLSQALAAAIGVAPSSNTPEAELPTWFGEATDHLKAAGAKALVIAGEQQSAYVHSVALALNTRLGAVGNTVDMIEPPHAMPVAGDLGALCRDIEAGAVRELFVLGANPVATAPADIDVAKALRGLTLLVHCGLYRDATAMLSHWHVPAAHDLEAWSDIRAYDGTASVVQPLIAPLFGGRTFHEILAVLEGDFNADPLSLVRATWATSLDEEGWRKALRDGVVARSSAASIGVSSVGDLPAATGSPPPNGLEARIVADPYLGDGRHANCAMLQELPHPLTKVVWSNVIMIAPANAEKLNVRNGQTIRVQQKERWIEGPAWITPGHPRDAVTLTLGRGQQPLGGVAGMASGYDAFRFRTADEPWIAAGVALTVGQHVASVVTTQEHQTMEGRAIVRFASLAHFKRKPDFVRDGVPPPPTESVYPDWAYPEEAWAMSIDLSTCVGCMACVAACQAENNIPSVGPAQCALGHEMHWLRVDRYYHGSPEDPETLFQPVPCMQCEKAPCEIVCPVNATVHTHDGLNAQVYNRCIGTRYCSQNCPFKVRRFNFLEFQNFDKETAGPRQAAYNPNVSVRSRGVMEKCTYCVQRISAKRIEAQIDNRPIADGEVVTACQQACPTQAITFGDKNSKQSRVSREKTAPHCYALLEELNTRPRTTYLGRIRNITPGQGEADG
uniref:TAT-variant-translocated molybdopterin oxidoreductase n=1 Tax=Mesorhizobium sp. WSM4875 TaxID=3038539 RepID=UPI002417B3D8|nr:TAT-variant-translocated molybdopterin oxidoreductase [Mesorhizobium sp. WSM4875]WIE94684.1 TAT-variant-translocated molybdopterin oxidoreductase [Mesorhizobium sp. WSM4875]